MTGTQKSTGGDADDASTGAVQPVPMGRQELFFVEEGARDADRVCGMLQSQNVLQDRR